MKRNKRFEPIRRRKRRATEIADRQVLCSTPESGCTHGSLSRTTEFGPCRVKRATNGTSSDN